NDDRNTRLDDSRLFGGNIGTGVAKQIHVVVANIGDNGKDGRDDVRRIEPTTQSGLDYRNVYLLAREMVEGHHRGNLEKRRLDRFDEGAILFDKSHDHLVGYHFDIDSITILTDNHDWI